MLKRMINNNTALYKNSGPQKVDPVYKSHLFVYAANIKKGIITP